MTHKPQRLLAYKYAVFLNQVSKGDRGGAGGCFAQVFESSSSLTLNPEAICPPRLCPQIISGLECTRQHMGFLFLDVFFRFVWAYTGSLLAVLLLSSHLKIFFILLLLSLLPFIFVNSIFLKGESDIGKISSFAWLREKKTQFECLLCVPIFVNEAADTRRD